MSKAILVMDMPSSCDVCDFVDERYCHCGIPGFGKDVSDYVACRHQECPLKPMPSKKEEWIKTSGTSKGVHGAKRNGFNTGYNACVDEILGGSEE